MNSEGTDKAFTLAELLVTIAIMAVLATMLLPVMKASLLKGEKARAVVEMASIASAIENYHREYARMPCFLNGTADATYHAEGATLLQNEVISRLRLQDTNNVRGIVFLDLPVKSMVGTDRAGRVYTASDGYYLDPWGNPYIISMDTDFDGELNITIPEGNLMTYLVGMYPRTTTATFPGLTVAVMSYGPDPGKTNSFMMSWVQN